MAAASLSVRTPPHVVCHADAMAQSLSSFRSPAPSHAAAFKGLRSLSERRRPPFPAGFRGKPSAAEGRRLQQKRGVVDVRRAQVVAMAGRRDSNMDDLANAVLELAEDLAQECGEIIRRKSGRAIQVEQKEVRTDLVTEVDRECEALIRSHVQRAFPLHRLLGEETATEEDLARLESPKEGEWLWIVDPIDGTLNFVGGMPFSTVAIGVACGSTLEVGVVYDPFHDELFSARLGEGACLNGRRISVLSNTTELCDATVSVGFPSQLKARSEMLSAMAEVAPKVRTMRALGSAALHMSYVAAGRLGAFFELDLKPWDIAGARLIVEEAGGRVTSMDGRQLSLRGGSVLATNGSAGIHEGLLGLLKGRAPSEG